MIRLFWILSLMGGTFYPQQTKPTTKPSIQQITQLSKTCWKDQFLVWKKKARIIRSPLVIQFLPNRKVRNFQKVSGKWQEIPNITGISIRWFPNRIETLLNGRVRSVLKLTRYKRYLEITFPIRNSLAEVHSVQVPCP